MSDYHRARQIEDEEALRAVLATVPGRRVLARILTLAGVERASYISEKPHATAYQEGRRAVGLELLAECLRVSPPDYIHMRSEAVSRQHEEALQASAESTRD